MKSKRVKRVKRSAGISTLLLSVPPSGGTGSDGVRGRGNGSTELLSIKTAEAPQAVQ